MRKPELTPEIKEKIIGCIREHPKNISRICGHNDKLSGAHGCAMNCDFLTELPDSGSFSSASPAFHGSRNAHIPFKQLSTRI